MTKNNSVAIGEEIHSAVKKHCESNGMSIQRFVEAALAHAVSSGITVKVSYQVHVPGEKPQDLDQSLPKRRIRAERANA